MCSICTCNFKDLLNLVFFSINFHLTLYNFNDIVFLPTSKMVYINAYILRIFVAIHFKKYI